MIESTRCPLVENVLVPTAEECAAPKLSNWIIGFASLVSGARRRCHILPASTEGNASAEDKDFETNGLEEPDDDEDDDKKDEKEEDDEWVPETKPEDDDEDFDDD